MPAGYMAFTRVYSVVPAYVLVCLMKSQKVVQVAVPFGPYHSSRSQVYSLHQRCLSKQYLLSYTNDNFIRLRLVEPVNKY
jgi:hypothetical protein